jgi:RNA polymerase sigma factor (sigma-70 family)
VRRRARLTREAGASLSELETVYRERYPELLRVAAAICQDIDPARDAVHDAFVGLIRSRRTYRRGGSLSAWVWAAVVNASRKQARRLTNPPVRLGGDPSLPGSYEADSRVRFAIARLPERQRLVLFLRYYSDLDYATIGETLGIATGTVAAALNAAHVKLRRDLEEVVLDA